MADINIGAILEALNNKIDRDGHNAQSPCAVVVDKQDPTSANNYTWYRKWSDGWVEQGGVATITSNGNSITLPIEMTDTNYDVFSIVMINTGAYNRCYGRNTTTISMASSGGNNTSSWQVSGMAAN